MNESMDRVLADWLHEGPETGPREGLERALAATRRVGQRPGWTFPERWLPMQMTMARTPSLRPILAIVMLALLMLALVATALFVASQRRESLPPFGNGAVVYAQHGDLFIADQLRGTPRILVAGPDEESDPVFSPQGDRIAFVRRTPDGSQVMTVRPDGSGVTELAREPLVANLHLDWAPDWSALLASRDGYFNPVEKTGGVGTKSWQLLLIASDGSGSRIIDAGPDTPGGPAAWRPDGRHIAFLARWERTFAVFIADASGTNVRRLPIGADEATDGLAWSPDGTRLSFMRRGVSTSSTRSPSPTSTRTAP